MSLGYIFPEADNLNLKLVLSGYFHVGVLHTSSISVQPVSLGFIQNKPWESSCSFYISKQLQITFSKYSGKFSKQNEKWNFETRNSLDIG